MAEADNVVQTDAGAAANDIRHLSVEQLAQLGMSEVAYVKPVVLNGTRAFAIHAADGSPMAVAGDEGLALAAILEHEMAAARVH